MKPTKWNPVTGRMTATQLHRFDPATGELLGFVIVDRDDYSDRDDLTDVDPPKDVPALHRAKWDGKAWKVESRAPRPEPGPKDPP